jgi:hypothetical protein
MFTFPLEKLEVCSTEENGCLKKNSSHYLSSKKMDLHDVISVGYISLRLRISGMWCNAVWWMVTTVLEEKPTSSGFNHLPGYLMPHPRRQ